MSKLEEEIESWKGFPWALRKVDCLSALIFGQGFNHASKAPGLPFTGVLHGANPCLAARLGASRLYH